MGLQRRITQFLTAVRQGLITDVPPEYQACESCREPNCNTEKALKCEQRIQAEDEEKRRRDPGNK